MDRGLAIVVRDDGVQVLQPEDVPPRGRLDRPTESQMQRPAGGSTVVRSSALDFFRRLIARWAACIARMRRFFALTRAKDANRHGSEERGVARDEINVEEGLVEASGACEPQLAEIIVCGSKGTLVEMLPCEDGGGACSRPIPVDNEQLGAFDGGESTLRADNHGSACEVESGSSCEQAPTDPVLPTPADTASGEPAKASSSVPCPPQDGSLDDFTQNQCVTAEAPSPLPRASDSKLETSVNESAFQPPSSQDTEKSFSLHRLNATVTEQLTKYLQVLERATVPGTLNQSKHRRAIIVATMAAVAVWARNSKHLHESEPHLEGSRINVHIRSRL